MYLKYSWLAAVQSKTCGWEEPEWQLNTDKVISSLFIWEIFQICSVPSAPGICAHAVTRVGAAPAFLPPALARGELALEIRTAVNAEPE